MASSSRRARTVIVIGAVALLVAAGVAVAAVRPGQPERAPSTMATTSPTVTTSSPRSPAPHAPAPRAPAPHSPEPPADPPGGSPTGSVGVGSGGTDAVTDTGPIVAFGRTLVEAISHGDEPTLSRLLCGQLATELAAQPVQPDPTVYDHVADIAVATDTKTATATVYAYKVRRGPPARPLKLGLQYSGSGWQACSILGD